MSVTPAPAAPSIASRVASLADSVFGVAMTLLAYDITVPENHDTRALLGYLAPKVYALALSFAVSAMYWLNQQRRLAHYYGDETSSRVVAAEFLLLFAVVLMPITTRSFVVSHNAVLYSANLTVLACLNAGLAWLTLHHARSLGRSVDGRILTMPLINAGFFVLTFVQGIFWPDAVHNVWFVAFTFPLLSRFFPSLRGAPDDQT